MTENNKVKVDKDLKELIPMFLDNRSQDIKDLKELLADKKYKKIEDLGHKIKGSGGGYGFNKVTELGKKIEKAAAEENFSRVEALIETFAEYMDKVEIVYE